jgi:hypothetical protein
MSGSGTAQMTRLGRQGADDAHDVQCQWAAPARARLRYAASAQTGK